MLRPSPGKLRLCCRHAGGNRRRDSATFTGAEGFTGTLAATEGADSAAFSGVSTFGVAGTLAATEGADAAAFSGTVGAAPITGTLAATEGADTALFAGSVAGAVTGTLAATEGADGASFTGIGGIVIPSAKGAGGVGVGGKARKRRRTIVRIDEQEFEVRSKEEALALLKKARETAKEAAKAQASEIVAAKPAKAKGAPQKAAAAMPLLAVPDVEISGEEPWVEALQPQVNEIAGGLRAGAGGRTAPAGGLSRGRGRGADATYRGLMDEKQQEMRGEEARRILENPIYKEAYAVLEQRIVAELAQQDIEALQAERLRMLLVALRKVRVHMEQVLVTGTIVAQELERKRTMRDRFKLRSN